MFFIIPAFVDGADKRGIDVAVSLVARDGKQEMKAINILANPASEIRGEEVEIAFFPGNSHFLSFDKAS
jgi:hypothetical protein